MSRIARVVLLLGASLPLLAQSSPIVFQNVRVFDGVRTIRSTTVVISAGRIASIGKSASPGPDAHVIDGKDKTLLPGFIDAHTHTISETAPQQAPIFGVTTDLDMFTMPALAAGLKKQKAEGKNRDYADELSAGYLATSPGGHGTEYGIKAPTLERPDEAQAWVDARVAEGSDYIKIVYDDSREYGSPTPRPTLS